MAKNILLIFIKNEPKLIQSKTQPEANYIQEMVQTKQSNWFKETSKLVKTFIISKMIIITVATKAVNKLIFKLNLNNIFIGKKIPKK